MLTVFLSACVSPKKLTYFQGKPTSSFGIKKSDNTPYRLQIDDILNITITSKNADIVAVFQKGINLNAQAAQATQFGQGYFLGYSIDNYGNIRIPTLGEINVLGYTEVEVRKKIESKLREEYIKNDESLFVSVKLSGIRYTIIGEISQSGTNTINQNRVSIIDAIASSGDITSVGNRQEVEIIRQTAKGTQKFIVDLTTIDILNSEVFYIRSNDIINIKPLKEKSWGTGTTGLKSLTTIVSLFTLLTSTIILARNL
jgi:polysaccharide export outer membrane protein